MNTNASASYPNADIAPHTTCSTIPQGSVRSNYCDMSGTSPRNKGTYFSSSDCSGTPVISYDDPADGSCIPIGDGTSFQSQCAYQNQDANGIYRAAGQAQIKIKATPCWYTGCQFMYLDCKLSQRSSTPEWRSHSEAPLAPPTERWPCPPADPYLRVLTPACLLATALNWSRSLPKGAPGHGLEMGHLYAGHDSNKPPSPATSTSSRTCSASDARLLTA